MNENVDLIELDTNSSITYIQYNCTYINKKYAMAPPPPTNLYLLYENIIYVGQWFSTHGLTFQLTNSYWDEIRICQK